MIPESYKETNRYGSAWGRFCMVLAIAPPDEVDPEIAQWFAQFNQDTWENDHEFITDFPKWVQDFAETCMYGVNNKLFGPHTNDAIVVAAFSMNEQLHNWMEKGYYQQ